MTNTITILGSGAAPGVPSLSSGFGRCNPENKKNYRKRTTTYFDYNGVKFLIDTSPDLSRQLFDNNVKCLDAVLYTHAHADHLHGIDDLREINRIMGISLNIYAISKTIKNIKNRFDYLIAKKKEINPSVKAALIPNKIKINKPFYIKDLKIVTAPLVGHIIPTIAYVFNDGEVVYLSDCADVDDKLIKQIKVDIKVLILPLTNPEPHEYHMGLDKVNEIIKKINPKQVIINHMSTNCDYDEINNLTANNVFPAFDGMKVEF